MSGACKHGGRAGTPGVDDYHCLVCDQEKVNPPRVESETDLAERKIAGWIFRAFAHIEEPRKSTAKEIGLRILNGEWRK